MYHLTVTTHTHTYTHYINMYVHMYLCTILYIYMNRQLPTSLSFVLNLCMYGFKCIANTYTQPISHTSIYLHGYSHTHTFYLTNSYTSYRRSYKYMHTQCFTYTYIHSVCVNNNTHTHAHIRACINMSISTSFTCIINWISLTFNSLYAYLPSVHAPYRTWTSCYYGSLIYFGIYYTQSMINITCNVVTMSYDLSERCLNAHHMCITHVYEI